MDYSNNAYTSTRSGPPKIESEVDKMPVADRQEINGILSELGVDETAENILKDEEFADVFMYAELTPDSAEEYWRATLDNSEVVADIQLAFVVGDRIEGPYTAGNVVKPAYDVFKVDEYLPEQVHQPSVTVEDQRQQAETD